MISLRPARRHRPSPDSIINPEAPLALRLSGQLMLGVVRIYSRKVGYLYQDTNEALLKIQQVPTTAEHAVLLSRLHVSHTWDAPPPTHIVHPHTHIRHFVIMLPPPARATH